MRFAGFRASFRGIRGESIKVFPDAHIVVSGGTSITPAAARTFTGRQWRKGERINLHFAGTDSHRALRGTWKFSVMVAGAEIPGNGQVGLLLFADALAEDAQQDPMITVFPTQASVHTDVALPRDVSGEISCTC